MYKKKITHISYNITFFLNYNLIYIKCYKKIPAPCVPKKVTRCNLSNKLFWFHHSVKQAFPKYKQRFTHYFVVNVWLVFPLLIPQNHCSFVMLHVRMYICSWKMKMLRLQKHAAHSRKAIFWSSWQTSKGHAISKVKIHRKHHPYTTLLSKDKSINLTGKCKRACVQVFMLARTITIANQTWRGRRNNSLS